MKKAVGTLIIMLFMCSSASACINDREVKIIEDDLKEQTQDVITEKNAPAPKPVDVESGVNVAGVTATSLAIIALLGTGIVYIRRK